MARESEKKAFIICWKENTIVPHLNKKSMQTVIYQPKGKAREYSPLALNMYNGCDHGCKYCYMKNLSGEDYNKKANPRNGFMEKLKKEISKSDKTLPILLCFAGDPYCHENEKLNLTRQVLEALYENGNKVSILTKGGKRCLVDIDLFKKFKDRIEVGQTMTFITESKQKDVEVNASSPQERIFVAKTLKENGIKTWASLEPVLDDEETLAIIEATHQYIDKYKLGKVSRFFYKDINWDSFARRAISLFKKYDKDFFIKIELQNEIKNIENLNLDSKHLTFL